MRKTNLLFGIALLLLFALFFVDNPDFVPTRSFRIAWNLGHIVFYWVAIFVLLKHASFLQQLTQAHQLYWIVGICFVTGVLIESIQFFIGRQAGWQDILRNILGGLSALAFFRRPKSTNTQLFNIKFKVIVTALLFIQLYPLLVTLADEQMARSNFPLLADFENKLELNRWTSNGSITLDKKFTDHGLSSARIELTTDPYSGASLNFLPNNWKKFDRILFSIYLPDNSPLLITTRIHDQQHQQGEQLHSDRFQQRYRLQPGWNPIAINLSNVILAPKTRQMDIESIANIHFYTSNLKQSRVIYLDNLRLE
jgi:VanZ family protein